MSTGKPSLKQAGLSLVELLVALTIGAVLIWGATQVYVDSKKAYTGNEGTSRMQETARYAMSVLESDIRLAGYWGLINSSSTINGKASATDTVSPLASGASAIACGNNFAVDLDNPMVGTNNVYSWPSTCNSLKDLDGATWNASPVASSDTLVIRRVSSIEQCNTGNATASCVAYTNQLQLCANRQSADLYSTSADSANCTDSDPATAQSTRARSLRNLEVYAYYVDQNSKGLTGVPSLRRKALCVGTGGTSCTAVGFIDEEVISGVEDMQVQYGITDGVGGGIATGIATRYVNADQVGTNPVVAVRLWLLVRSDTPDIGFVDGTTYQYADRLTSTGTTADLGASGAGKAYAPSTSTSTSPTAAKAYHRILVSRTIQLRNAAGT